MSEPYYSKEFYLYHQCLCRFKTQSVVGSFYIGMKHPLRHIPSQCRDGFGLLNKSVDALLRERWIRRDDDGQLIITSRGGNAYRFWKAEKKRRLDKLTAKKARS